MLTLPSPSVSLPLGTGVWFEMFDYSPRYDVSVNGDLFASGSLASYTPRDSSGSYGADKSGVYLAVDTLACK